MVGQGEDTEDMEDTEDTEGGSVLVSGQRLSPLQDFPSLRHTERASTPSLDQPRLQGTAVLCPRPFPRCLLPEDTHIPSFGARHPRTRSCYWMCTSPVSLAMEDFAIGWRETDVG